MLEATVIIVNKVGLHARPAALLVQTASSFSSEVSIIKDSKICNAKSILSLMGAGIKLGDNVTIKVNGPDEQAALLALKELVESGFREA